MHTHRRLGVGELVFHGSLSKWSQLQRLYQAKVRKWNSIWVSQLGGRNPSTWAIFSCLPVLAELYWQENGWKAEQPGFASVLTWDASISDSGLASCSFHSTGPRANDFIFKIAFRLQIIIKKSRQSEHECARDLNRHFPPKDTERTKNSCGHRGCAPN